jgi:ribulose-phosphate 3-epimerase
VKRAPLWKGWFRDVEVAPSIYAADFSQLGAQLIALLEAGARIFHVDVGDGHFIEDITVGPVVVRSIAPIIHGRLGVVSCHLMVEQPERHFAHLKSAGADMVSFHLEACADAPGTTACARDLGLGVGVAFNPETSVESAAAAAEPADFVLCMSIHPGLSGQTFMLDAFARISELRRLLPDTVLAVDGGVHENNIAAVRAAGADVLVAGSAVFWRDDPATAYRHLCAILEDQDATRI